MAHAFLIGNTMVSSEELAEKSALGTLDRFHAEAQRDATAALRLRAGTVTADEVFAAPETVVPGYEPIGFGKPMSIEILAVYTGDAPNRIFGRPDLLVTTAVKGIETVDVAPRAINQIVENIQDRQYIQPSALTEGSPIAYWTPSLVNSTLTCTFQLVADTFNEKALHHIGSLLKTAGGIPIFAPASAYLMAGSVVTDVIGKVGKSFLESKPFLHDDLILRFDTPGFPVSMARQVVLFNHVDREALAGHKSTVISEAGGHRVAMVGPDGEEYQGDAPYVIVSLDGRPRKALKDFTPRLVTAAVLERFLGASDPGGQAVEALQSAMELYNDFSFHQKVKGIQNEIADLDEESETYDEDKAALEALLEAYAGNIRNEMFEVAA
jgi:hypothetical protein